METAFQVTAILTITFTIVAIVDKKAWWIRVFDFPRLQIIILQIISIAGMLLIEDDISWTDGILAGITFIALIVQISYIFPYFSVAKKEVPDYKGNSGRKLSIMVANVLMENRESKALLNLVAQHQPDIFLAVETDEWWAKQTSTLDEEYRYTLKCPLDNTYGMLLFSKFPLQNAKIDYLVKKYIPSMHADVKADNFTFKLACLHPEPPAPEEAQTSLPRDRELVVMARNIKETRAPWVVIGDFNDVAWSDTSYKFQSISELKDPRKGRGFFNTFNAKYPFMRWALDHVFLSEHFSLVEMRRMPYMGSDHFPIFLTCTID